MRDYKRVGDMKRERETGRDTKDTLRERQGERNYDRKRYIFLK